MYRSGLADKRVRGDNRRSFQEAVMMSSPSRELQYAFGCGAGSYVATHPANVRNAESTEAALPESVVGRVDYEKVPSVAPLFQEAPVILPAHLVTLALG